MGELRTSHELFNKIADVIEFQPNKYNQNVWGESATQFVGDDYIMWDPVNQDFDDLNRDPKDLVEETRVDDACGTAACVAGWASLLSGYHPTIQTIEINSSDDNREGYYGRYFPTLFNKFGQKIFSMFRDRISYNYNVMCDMPNVETPFMYESGNTMQMEDCQIGGTIVNGIKYHRPDYLAAELLDLDDYDACALFDAEHTWDGDDLRRIGKGMEVQELLDEKYDWCHGCDNSCDDCECD